MKKPGAPLPLLRGLTVQLFVITVLPLTLLLLAIAFGSYSLHQRDMRALVSERNERAVQSAAATLESELHHHPKDDHRHCRTQCQKVHTTNDVSHPYEVHHYALPLKG